jgi:signal transduction histidine kinase
MAMSAQVSSRRRMALVVFELSVVVPTVVGGAYLAKSYLAGGNKSDVDLWSVIGWGALVAIAELLPVPTFRGRFQLAMGFPLLMMAAFYFDPIVAATIAFVGSFDPREIRREISLVHALFNRCQVALSVFAASLVFHSFASFDSKVLVAAGAAVLAAIADYLINACLVTAYISIRTGASPVRVIREVKIGSPTEFLVSYVGLGVLGLVLAVFFDALRWWTVIAVIAPLLFARQMFLRTQSLEEAHKELQEREQVLRSLSNAMAEERADERQRIAAYLHDDLAQVLFRLSIQVDVARKLLDKGEIPETADQLEKIKESKQDTSDRIRALIRDLHRSPLGAKGLAEALESFTDEVGRDSGVSFHHHVEDVEMPAPIALLIYHIAREGVMNALKHAQATDIWVTVSEHDDDLELQLRDNGRGFDTSAPGPEGHFGMAMMRERAQVGGGRFAAESAPAQGTTITVRFPTSLLQQDPQAESNGGDPAADTPPGHASPGTSEPTEPVADGSRGTVHV